MVLQQAELDAAVRLGNADSAAKAADRLGRVTPAANSGERRHPRVVPAAHVSVLNQGQQLSLAEQRVRQVQAIEFNLLRMINPELFDVPVVERTVVLELQRA